MRSVPVCEGVRASAEDDLRFGGESDSNEFSRKSPPRNESLANAIRTTQSVQLDPGGGGTDDVVSATARCLLSLFFCLQENRQPRL